MSSSSTNGHVGTERLKADTRQFGGIILALGICAMFGALSGVAAGVSRDGGTPSENGIPLWSLIGACCQAFFGAVAIVVGYLSAVADTGHKNLTLFLCIAIQLAWIPYITGMSGLGKQARNPETQTMIPTDLEPSDFDIKFVAGIGITTIFAHGFAFIGSLAFASFSLLAYQSDRHHERAAGYYHGRLVVYSLIVVLAGFTQLVLGVFIMEQYGGGPLDNPINVAVYTVFFPEISVSVGVVQILTGAVGVFRYLGRDLLKATGSWSFQFMCFFMWLMMMVLELMVQVSFAPGAAFAAAAPTRACMLFGMAFMPAYLDYKMHNTPDIIEPRYYGLCNKNDEFEQNEKLQDDEKEGFNMENVHDNDGTDHNEFDDEQDEIQLSDTEEIRSPYSEDIEIGFEME